MNIDVRKALTQSDSESNLRVTLNLWESDTPELRAIIAHHLPQWAELFASKNSEYGSGSAFELGERGQFSDIYRKIIKLKRAMWDADESVLTTEGVDEIIMDLIGHCFLTLEMRRRRFGNDLGMPVPDEVAAPMSVETFERLVQDAGLYVLKPDDQQYDGLAEDVQESVDATKATAQDIEDAKAADPKFGRKGYRGPDGADWYVGEKVRLKQHLGKGPLLTIIDAADRKTGHDILISDPHFPDKAMWAHVTWLVKEGRESVEEQLIRSLKEKNGGKLRLVEDPEA